MRTKIIKLYMDSEGFYDSGWDCERGYYFVRDARQQRTPAQPAAVAESEGT